MIHWLDHLVIVLFAVALPIESYFGYRRFVAQVRRGEPGVRLRQYRVTTVVQWGLFALALTSWIVARRPFSDLGLRFDLDLRAIAVTATCLAFAWYYHRQIARLFRSEAAIDRLGKSIRPIAELLPNDREERDAFIALSLTAGVCEELLFRGFFLWYLSNAMPMYVAILVSTAIFGIGHAYQGRVGIVKTGAVGLVMCLLYVAGRTLYPLMILHAIIDVVGGLMGYEYIRRRGAGPRPAPPAQPAAA